MSSVPPKTGSSPLPQDDGTPPQHNMHRIFIGSNGIRAGWRLALAIAIFLALLTTISGAITLVPHARSWAFGGGPVGLFFSEGMLALALVLAVSVMTRIEKRSWAEYGLPSSAAFGKRFWQGVPYGFAMLSVLMGLMAASRVFSFGGRALTGGDAVHYGLLYLAGFTLVAFFEEFSFRGYMQATLASGIGFWPAAVSLAVVFGALHLGNKGEAEFGAAMAGAFGLLAAFTLRRTGDLWFAIGMHGAWDWGESFFYGVPDSGVVLKGHLMNASFHGPAWLTGGTVGPEGSVLAAAVLVLAAIGIHYIFARQATT
ncbi:MAG TPA: type II CAAX endopeptidase family protein [Candidatus Acidoferrales bacterium]|nr:type II CAAX endopeptidase family protein [Candidatus Acidoferrales bacterium]